MNDALKVLFGAAVGFIAALVSDYLKRRHTSKTAAIMILRELDFHKQRLNLVMLLDQNKDASYGIKFPSTVWDANSKDFLLGASPKKSEAVLNWYASLAVLGNSLSSENDQLDRNAIHSTLTNAHNSVRKRTLGISRRKHSSWRLFEDITLSNSKK